MKKIGYFEGVYFYKFVIVTLSCLVAFLVILVFVAFRMTLSTAQNKTIHIQVPQFFESGNYVIGATHASENVLNMWSRVWVEQIATFSYSNIRKKYEFLYPFLDDQTVYKNKTELLKFMEFVETNFVSQKFSLTETVVKQMARGFYQIDAYGTLHRTIGNEKDSLDGMRYAYQFVVYVKQGQIYIYSISSSFYGLTDVVEKNKLKANKFVNFDEIMQ